jgi:hypothetical protein
LQRKITIITDFHESSTLTGPRNVHKWGIALIVVYSVLVIPILYLDAGGTDDAVDQKNYHEPFILQLIAQWPNPDLANTHGVAMTPGYHLLLASASYYSGISIFGSRVITAVIGALTIFASFWFCARWVKPSIAFLLTLPFMFSSFVLGSSLWLRPDNISLLSVIIALGLMAHKKATPAVVICLGAIIAFSVFVRQVNIWLIAPLGLFALLSIIPSRGQLVGLVPNASIADAWRLTAAAIVAAALPLSILAYFFLLWGGLLPPEVAAIHPAGNGLANLSVIFALTGFFGVFFVLLITRPNFAQLLRDPFLWGAAAVGFMVAVIPPTGEPAGSSGFLLEIQKTPILFDRVILLIPLSILGGIVLLLLVRTSISSGQQLSGIFILASFLIWTVAMASNVYVFRRYSEPFILLCLAWLTAMGVSHTKNKGVTFWFFGILIIIQLVAVTAKIYLPAFSSL